MVLSISMQPYQGCSGPSNLAGKGGPHGDVSWLLAFLCTYYWYGMAPDFLPAYVYTLGLTAKESGAIPVHGIEPMRGYEPERTQLSKRHHARKSSIEVLLEGLKACSPVCNDAFTRIRGSHLWSKLIIPAYQMKQLEG